MLIELEIYGQHWWLQSKGLLYFELYMYLGSHIYKQHNASLGLIPAGVDGAIDFARVSYIICTIAFSSSLSLSNKSRPVGMGITGIGSEHHAESAGHVSWKEGNYRMDIGITS